jgi:hypothetical protein
VFDESVEIPGLLKTTGYLSLVGISPNALAGKIIRKLSDSGVLLSVVDEFSSSGEAKSDVDFQMPPTAKLTPILKALRSCNWYKQAPAMEKILEMDLGKIPHDEVFVLGRNIYQCACGGERNAVAMVSELRRTLAEVPLNTAEHLLNGMFYEIYFNSKGEFRGDSLKRKCLDELFAIQSVDKYQKCIKFIRHVLQPYRKSIVVMPGKVPEIVQVELRVSKKDPQLVTSIKCGAQEHLIDSSADVRGRMWTHSFRTFYMHSLKKDLSEEWGVPIEQIQIETRNGMNDSAEFRLPKGKSIARPIRS